MGPVRCQGRDRAIYYLRAPSSVLAIAELHEPGTVGILRRMATRKARHEQEADDFVSHSLIRVLDPDDMPWLPATRPLLLHMRVVIRRVAPGDRCLHA